MLIQTDDIALQQASLDNGDECTPPGAPVHVQFVNRDRTITEQLYAPIVAGHVHNRDRLKVCLTGEYREAHIHLHAHTFGLPRCQTYNFVVFYHADLIFNIEVPQVSVSDYTPTVYDAIWDLRGEPIEPYNGGELSFTTVMRTPEAVKPWIAKMATGWTLREVLRYSNTDTALDNDAMQHMLRLAWCVTCQPMSSKSSLWLHPWHHRRLTLGELARLAGYYANIDNDTLGCDVGMALWHITQSVPTPICEWLLRQFEWCLSGVWTQENGGDWQGEYRHNGVKLNSDGVWTINDATGQDVKRFMLYDLRPQAYDYDRFEKEAKLQFYNFGDL